MLIAISGLIGAGKSTLVESLPGKHYFEPVESNPYLADYYKDAKRWCFPMQMHLLHERYRMIRAAYTHQLYESEDAIMDRSIYEDFCFAKLGYEAGYMSEREFSTYCKAHENYCNDLIPFPDLIIHLDAPVNTLIDHIRTRDRECEAGVMAGYLKSLQEQYNHLLPQLAQKAPLRYIDARRTKGDVLSAAVDMIEQRRKELKEQAVPRYRCGI